MADHQEMRDALFRAVEKAAEDKNLTPQQYIDLFYSNYYLIKDYLNQPTLV